MKHTLFATLALIFSCHSSADDHLTFMTQYLQDFANNEDLSQYFIEQPTFIFGLHTHTPENALEASKLMHEIRARLAGVNYGSSRIDNSQIRAQIDHYSLVTLTLTRFKQDGSKLDTVCSTYGVLNTEKGLKIISWQPSQLTNQNQC